MRAPVLLTWLAAAVTHAVAAGDHCAVLQYQHIDDNTPGVVSVTPQQFQQHLDHLVDNDYAVMPLDEVVAALKADRDLPDKCVALTIDNAYRSAYTEAFPRVRRYGLPLTVFVSTKVVDDGVAGHLRWTEIQEMHAQGVRFHSQGHERLHLIRRLDDESVDDWEQRVATDIQTAQNRLHSVLGVRPSLFAYPFGEYNDALRAIVRSMGLDAFGQHAGPVWRTADFTAMPRFTMASFFANVRALPRKLDSLPLPITGAFPLEPVVPLDEWRPALTLVFRADVDNRERLRCTLNGSPEISYEWLDQPAGAVVITPKGRLNVGRNRTHCTLPGVDGDRHGWYSHNWFRRHADGSWYRERP